MKCCQSALVILGLFNVHCYVITFVFLNFRLSKNEILTSIVLRESSDDLQELLAYVGLNV